MNWFDRLFALHFTWRDAVDVLVVAIILYNILALLRGTRAMQASIGLVLLGSTFFVARAFDLPALEAISRQILFYLPFAVIVLFQAEIRRALARMVGGNPVIGFMFHRRVQIPFAPILDACEILARRRIGALIAIEATQTLRAYEEGAKPLDAILTTELLISIFTPGGPLHDGAVIVRGNRIAAAGAFLPLTASADPKLAHGTRHRAALGVSEETDTLVIVISEENGSMAAAYEGTLDENLDRAALFERMNRRFGGTR